MVVEAARAWPPHTQHGWLRQGCLHVPSVLTLGDMQGLSLPDLAMGAVGGDRQLLAQPWCQALVQRLLADARLQAVLPADPVAVQCTYFEKSSQRNWLVPVHQDLSVPVAHKVDGEGLGGWSCKDGVWFVQPPAEWLAQLVALRLHLDPCGPHDGAVQVVPETHAHGVLSPEAAQQLKHSHGTQLCTAQPGDVWAMRPLLLHASSKGSGHSRRRVLHVLVGPRHWGALPLQWGLTVAPVGQ